MAAAATQEYLVAVDVGGISLSCPPIFVQLGRSVCNCSSVGGGEEEKHYWPDDRFIRGIL